MGSQIYKSASGQLVGPDGQPVDITVDDVVLDEVQVTKFGLGLTPIARRTTVADASVAHALNGTFSDTEVETALDALGTKINAILATLEAFGLHAAV